MNNMQIEETQQQRAGIEQFYRAKYPESVGKADASEAEAKLTPQERQEQNQAFSDGLFKANQRSNADMLSKLAESFKARKAGTS